MDGEGSWGVWCVPGRSQEQVQATPAKYGPEGAVSRCLRGTRGQSVIAVQCPQNRTSEKKCPEVPGILTPCPLSELHRAPQEGGVLHEEAPAGLSSGTLWVWAAQCSQQEPGIGRQCSSVTRLTGVW